MKYKFCFLLFIFVQNIFAFNEGEKLIYVPSSFDKFISIAPDAYMLENKSGRITIDSLNRHPDNYKFRLINKDKEDLGFTTSEYWIKFRILYNGEAEKSFYLETARPVTNTAELYQGNNKGGYTQAISGDGIPADKKNVQHRSTVFKINLQPMQVNTFYMKIASDGEALNLPIKLWTPEGFWRRDYKEQYVLGIYYGILLFVSMIYFFFYAALKEKSFIYYVLYVLGVAALQFSLDGFSAQYFFRENVWLANRIVLFSACFGLFFLIAYARSFLGTKYIAKRIDRLLIGLLAITVLCFVFVFTEGILYQISFPLVNLLSLIGIIFIFISITKILKKNIHVCPLFITAFVCLTIGVAIFILNNLNLITSSFFTENGMKLGTGFEVIFLSFSMANKFKDLQKAKEEAQAVALEKLEEMNKLKDEINTNLEIQVKERTKEINEQKEIIEQKNKDITDSINYAQGIQEATLTDISELKKILPDSFVLFKPKDIVSGDFYWFAQKDDEVLVAAADCTGHGVPGALMSMLGNSFLNEIINEKNILTPSDILFELRLRVIKTLNRQGNAGEKFDGMDIALYKINTKDLSLEYAGAYNPLWVINKTGLTEIKGNKFPIGKMEGRDQNTFTNHKLQLNKNDAVYVFTDGYADQFGGDFGKKFKYKNLSQILLSNTEVPMAKQKEMLNNTIENWKGSYEQIDDILIIGVRV